MKIMEKENWWWTCGLTAMTLVGLMITETDMLASWFAPVFLHDYGQYWDLATEHPIISGIIATAVLKLGWSLGWRMLKWVPVELVSAKVRLKNWWKYRGLRKNMHFTAETPYERATRERLERESLAPPPGFDKDLYTPEKWVWPDIDVARAEAMKVVLSLLRKKEITVPVYWELVREWDRTNGREWNEGSERILARIKENKA